MAANALTDVRCRHKDALVQTLFNTGHAKEIAVTFYAYSMGNWTEGSSAPEWENGEDFADYIVRIGYSPMKYRAGLEHGAEIEIYTSVDAKRFFASVSPDGNNCYDVFISDFPSLMLFIRDFASAFSILGIETHQAEMQGMIEKLFNAFHGHDAQGICSKCSPLEWRAQQDRRRST